MKKIITIDGHAAITKAENGKVYFEFLPDNQQRHLLEGCHAGGKGMLTGNGGFCFTPHRRRVRNNDLLIQKAPHGRLSGTRDKAFQLTLKSFASEQIDWQRAFVKETVLLISDLMGEQQMAEFLLKLIVQLKTTQHD